MIEKPRYRVKAWTRRISMEEYFICCVKWSVAELRALADNPPMHWGPKNSMPGSPPMRRVSRRKPGEWMK